MQQQIIIIINHPNQTNHQISTLDTTLNNHNQTDLKIYTIYYNPIDPLNKSIPNHVSQFHNIQIIITLKNQQTSKSNAINEKIIYIKKCIFQIPRITNSKKLVIKKNNKKIK